MAQKPFMKIFGKSELRNDGWWSVITAKNQEGPEEESFEKGPFKTAEEARAAGLQALPIIQRAVAKVGGHTDFKDLRRVLQ